jgi:hypothetical protein
MLKGFPYCFGVLKGNLFLYSSLLFSGSILIAKSINTLFTRADVLLKFAVREFSGSGARVALCFAG